MFHSPFHKHSLNTGSSDIKGLGSCPLHSSHWEQRQIHEYKPAVKAHSVIIDAHPRDRASKDREVSGGGSISADTDGGDKLTLDGENCTHTGMVVWGLKNDWSTVRPVLSNTAATSHMWLSHTRNADSLKLDVL